MKRLILSGRPAPTEPFFCSGADLPSGRVGKERNTECISDRDAESEQDSLQPHWQR